MMQYDRQPATVQRVDLHEAKREFDRGTSVFVDVRLEDKYDESHIPGALAIPLAELARRAGELPSDKDILLY